MRVTLRPYVGVRYHPVQEEDIVYATRNCGIKYDVGSMRVAARVIEHEKQRAHNGGLHMV